jgi:transposase-like protein
MRHWWAHTFARITHRSTIMAMNRIQFQPGMSLSEFFDQFGTEHQREHALEEARWPRGFVCGRCASTHASRFEVAGTRYWQCSACRHQTSLRSGTIFHGSKLALRKWFQTMFLISQSKNQVSALELKRQLGVSYPTAWRVKHKLMEVMAEREARRVLHGEVVIDDAYLGGEHRGKAGRGSENKVPFVAAVQLSAQGRPQVARFDPVSGFTTTAIGDWAKRHLGAGSRVISDGLNCFPAVAQAGAVHLPEVVGTDRRSTDMACFAWINILLGNLKTSMSGTYHAFDFRKYGSRYLAEHQYRFNRRFDIKAIMPRLLRAAATTGPRSEAWLRSAEYSC